MRDLKDILQDMKAAPPPLLPILRSATQARLLTALFMDPELEHTVSELASLARTSVPTAVREIARAEQAGIFTTRQVGRSRLVRVDTGSYVYEPLRELLLRTFGPVAVVAEVLSGVPGIERAFIFGSWAAHYLGEPERAPGDLDVLVIGQPDPDTVDEAAEAAEGHLHRPVQITVRTAAQWEQASADPFLRQVSTHPLVEVDLSSRRTLS